MITILLFAFFANAHVVTKTERGENVHWESNLLSIKISTKNYGNSSFNLTTQELENIIKDSVGEWNSLSNIKIVTSVTDEKVSIGRKNTISFSEKENYFGNGILAVTKVSYDEKSGEIYQADILINDTSDVSFEFSYDPAETSSSVIYLGDVITHEMGHFLGLAHSEVAGSTMLFSVFKEQFSLHSDDVTGLRDLYGKEKPGKIFGTILASSQGIGVFGAHVQAIQVETGKVVSSTLTNREGKFTLKNLETYEEYVVYVSPLRAPAHLPIYYSSIRTDYCPGQYLGSFFSTCSTKGVPQEISLKEEKDLGEISIECHSNVNGEYLSFKNDQFVDSFPLSQDSETKHVVGMFYRDELDEVFNPLTMQKFSIDLSRKDLSNDIDSFIELKFLPELTASDLYLQVTVQRIDEVSAQTYNISYSGFEKLRINKIIQKGLSLDFENNIFEITVNAKLLENSDALAIFSSASEFQSEILLLPILVNVGYDALTEVRYLDLRVPISDNSACIQGQKSNPIRDYTDLFKNKDTNSKAAPTCGTVGKNRSSGGQFLFSLVVGLVIVAALRNSKKISTIILS